MSADLDTAQVRMDRMYRHQRRIYDLTRRYYLLGRDQLLLDLSPNSNGTILEVGCGTASNLVRAAHLYPRSLLYGFDISTEMLATARQSVRRRSLDASVTLAIGDATKFDTQALFGVPLFDSIFTSYTLSMIPNWPVVLEQMVRCLAPGGSIRVVDFGDCAGLPVAAKGLLYGWLEQFGVEPREDLQAVLRKVARTYEFQLAFAPLFRGYAQYGVLTKR